MLVISGAFVLLLTGRPISAVAAPVPSGCGWTIYQSGLATPRGALTSLTMVSSRDAWAVGGGQSGGVTTTLAEHWDGVSWTVIPSANPGKTGNGFRAVGASGSTDVWAVGSQSDAANGNPTTNLSEHWDGLSWSVIPTPSPGATYSALQGVAVLGRTSAWAVGFQQGDGLPKTLIEHWDGSVWKVIPSSNPYSGDNSLIGVRAFSESDVWAVGRGSNDPQGLASSAALIEHWDGVSWSVVTSPPPAESRDDLRSVAGSAGAMWAVGYDVVAGVVSPLTEYWGGSIWRKIAAPKPSTGEALLLGVATPAPSDVWSVGVSSGPQDGQALAEHWDGNAWSVVPVPQLGTGSSFEDVAFDSTADGWAVGYYRYRDLIPFPLIEHFTCPVAGPPTLMSTSPLPTLPRAGGAVGNAPSVPFVPLLVGIGLLLHLVVGWKRRDEKARS
jgi:hypothetical protein